MDQNVNPAPSYDAQELPPMVEPPKKTNKTWLIVLIVVLVLCCCCLVVGGLGYYMYVNGDQIFDMTSAIPALVG